MSRSSRERLTDIQEAIARIRQFETSLVGPDSTMALSAILREIGIIGEAVNRLPEAITSSRPEIPWRTIANMRNFLIHEYFNIDVQAVQHVIADDLAPLSASVDALLDGL